MWLAELGERSSPVELPPVKKNGWLGKGGERERERECVCFIAGEVRTRERKMPAGGDGIR
jgi:hypothetical protein